METDQAKQYHSDLLDLFDVPRERVRTFARSSVFLDAVGGDEPPIGELVLLTLEHVPSAKFLPAGMLVDDLKALTLDARTAGPDAHA